MSGSKKPCLPHGWVVHQSNSFPDRVYYFNRRTGVSSWECPELISKADSSQSPSPVPLPAPLADPSLVFPDRYPDNKKAKLPVSPKTTKLPPNFSSIFPVEHNLKLAVSSSKPQPKPSSIFTVTNSKEPLVSPSKPQPNPVSNSKELPTSLSKFKPAPETLSLKATSPPCVSSSSEVNILTKPSNMKSPPPTQSPTRRRRIKRPIITPSGCSKSEAKSSVRFKPYSTSTNTTRKDNNSVKSVSTRKKGKLNVVNGKCELSLQGTPLRKGQSPLTRPGPSKTQQAVKDLKTLQKRNEHFSLPNSSPENKLPPSTTSKSACSTPQTTRNPAFPVLEPSNSFPDCSTDVEMLDLSNDCTDSGLSEHYHIVVDTNVLMHNLTFVDELKDTPLEGCGPPLIIVPWVVLQELDGIKNRSVNSESVPRATKAVRYIHDMLSAKHPRFCGQNSWENPKELEGSLNPSCNDDMILNCCLQIIKKVPREKVILLSNDRNLCNKAMVHQLRAYSSDVFFQHLKSDFSPVSSAPAYAMSCNISVTNQLTESEERLRLEVDRIMMLSKSLLKSSLGQFLETEMIAVYKEDLWLNVVYRKPPWSLLDILECMIKHWTAVFNFVMRKQARNHIEKMSDAMKSTRGYVFDEEHALEIVSKGLSLCTDLASRGFTPAKETVEKLIPLQQQLLCLGKNNANEGSSADNVNRKLTGDGHTLSSVPTGDSIAPCSLSIDSDTKVKQLFQHVWAVLNHLCGTVLDALGWPHKLEYQRPTTLPSREETDKFIPILYPELQKLRKPMIEVVLNKDGKSLESIGSCYNQLLAILPALNVPEPVPVSTTEEEFRGFCTNPSNKELLQAGMKHLNQIFTLVHRSIVGTAKQH